VGLDQGSQNYLFFVAIFKLLLFCHNRQLVLRKRFRRN